MILTIVKSGNLNLREEVAMITRVRVRNGCTRFDESSGVTIPGNALHDHEAREGKRGLAAAKIRAPFAW